MSSASLFFGIGTDSASAALAPVRPVLEAMPGGVVFFDDTRRILAVNDEVTRLLGEPEERIVGQDAAVFASVMFGEEPTDEHTCLISRALSTGQSLGPKTLGLRRADGSVVWTVVRVVVARDVGGAIIGAVATMLDITERKRAEDELRHSEAKWRLLAKNLPDIVLMLDRTGRVMSTNRIASYFESLEVIGHFAYEFAHPDHAGAWQANFARSIGSLSPVRFEVRAGRIAEDIWYEQTLIPLVDESTKRVESVFSVVRDITERRKMNARLAERERATTVGMLSASVAHEVLNPLTSVLANLDFALSDRCPPGARRTKAIVDAREGAARMHQIVRDLRALGRANTEERFYVDVRSVIEMALRLAGHEVSKDVVVLLELEDVPGVYASESRLCQVFINLVMNAVQAMSDVPPEARKLVVRSRYEETTSRVAVEISDTGSGIRPEIINRIFDPFFTTKESGTGLGLSISRESVENMGGRIEVTSEVGEGATFTVWLSTTREAPSRP